MHQLYNLYAHALLNTAFRIVNNKEDAEDILQESFIKAFTQLHQFKYQSTFGAWIKRIVINTSIDALKKKNSTFFSTEINGYTQAFDETSDRLEPLKRRQINELYKALQDLPDGYRTVFSLYMLEGYDHQEIATILNIGVSSSISQLSRAKKKIRSLINKKISI